MKFRFPLTWFKCTIARSYAVCTDFRTLGFLPSIRRSLSAVLSIPIGSNLFRGSHCLKTKTHNFPGDRGAIIIIMFFKFSMRSFPNLTTFFWCQRTAPRRASPPLPFPWSRLVSAPPQEALGWGCRCEEAPPGAYLDQQSATKHVVSRRWPIPAAPLRSALTCGILRAWTRPHHGWVRWIASAFGPNQVQGPELGLPV